ncbi:stress-activated map kinase-interacting protein 1 [Moniliophthora roreri]|nr:stress-activated map kinase-interacting protein 1 [Moniliophthora roreri]
MCRGTARGLSLIQRYINNHMHLSSSPSGASTEVRQLLPSRHLPMRPLARKGIALWSYWGEGWLTKLNEGIIGEKDWKKK